MGSSPTGPTNLSIVRTAGSVVAVFVSRGTGGAGAGDAEHGDQPVVGDAHFGDQGFGGGLALGGGTAGDGIGLTVIWARIAVVLGALSKLDSWPFPPLRIRT